MKEKLKNYIGDRVFYRTVLTILIPIIIQNGITNFVSMLDNIMVGSLGTEQMSGVSIVNQYNFIFTLLIFGVISAAGIFTAQFRGVGDEEGIKATFRTKIYMCLISGVIGITVLLLFPTQFISLFLFYGNSTGNLELTMQYGKDYLKVIVIGLLPFALSVAFSSTMRETGETVFPMIAGFAAVGTNFILNCLLIFGLCGFPALGVVGAAIATVISRFVELACLVIYAFTNKGKCRYFRDSFKTFSIPKKLLKKIAISGLPLVANEFLWSLSVTFKNQCYSTRGLDSVAAQNIASTLTNLFSIVFLSMGTAISIIIGNLLGAGKLEEAESTDRKLIAFDMAATAVTAIGLIALGFVFPNIYNTSAEAKQIATYMIVVYAIFSPLWAYINSAYFTIRSGGQVFETMLSDSIFMWAVVSPTAGIVAYLTNLNIYSMYFICTIAECFKALLGWYLIKRKKWLRQFVSNELSE